MTTYQHTLTIGDGEYGALSDALKLMIELCEAQIKPSKAHHIMQTGSTATRCSLGYGRRPRR
jgi:hypothetical protein